MKSLRAAAVVCLLVLALSFLALGQSQSSPMLEDLKAFVATPAVPGYESDLAAKIAAQLSNWKPQRDNMGDVIVTIGSGAPHRLLVTPIDEPGFVVSGITPDGYLRLQRLPQNGLSPLWNELHSAQPVLIRARDGNWRNGAVAGLSVHLQPGRQHPPDLGDLDNIYVDVGANSAEEVKSSGIDVLDPLALDRTLYAVGTGKLSGPSVEDRFGAAALMQVLRDLDRSKVKGTLAVAFATQQWLGGRGVIRLIEALNPDEMLYVGPLTRSQGSQTPSAKTGTGVLIAQSNTAELSQELKQIADKLQVAVASEPAAPVVGGGRLLTPPPQLPARIAHVGIPVAWQTTPAQYIDGRDLAGLTRILEQYAQGESRAIEFPDATALPMPGAGARPSAAPTNVEILKRVVEAYGVSDHEAPVADAIAQLLPAWAKPVKDKSGNLILHWGGESKAPGIVVVAHQDEIGYEVKSIAPDGRIMLVSKGGGTPAFFAGHQTLIFTSAGIRPAVIELPQGWDQSNFQWPRERQFPFAADVGATSADEVAKLGIKVGDWATVPKKFRPLLGTRASARSFDDRMGCAALISAVWKLGPNRDRNVTFVWSTGEELGLLGASAVAQQLAEEKKAPAYVFAIDTFVSSDSPIESKRFGDALVGHGFVVRAVDNSSIVPSNAVNTVLQLAAAEKIPSQHGVTGGGNDGSAYMRYGTIDVPLGWPLRYSHSPAEVIDTRDLDALANIVAAVSRKWQP